jgi:hypothetical protein
MFGPHGGSGCGTSGAIHGSAVPSSLGGWNAKNAALPTEVDQLQRANQQLQARVRTNLDVPGGLIALPQGRDRPGPSLALGIAGTRIGFIAGTLIGVINDVILQQGVFYVAIIGYVLAAVGALVALTCLRTPTSCKSSLKERGRSMGLVKKMSGCWAVSSL